MFDFKSSIFGNWFFLVFLAFFVVFSSSFFYDYKALSSNLSVVCGQYLGDEVVRVGGSRSSNVEYLKILPKEDSDPIYFKKNLSLSKEILLWVQGSKANDNLSRTILGEEYCVTFSIAYRENLQSIYKSVPYLVNFEPSSEK